MPVHADSLADWLEAIERLHPNNIEMGLERAKTVRDRLGIRFGCPVIIVGGTNGKGSTCAMMEAIWQKAGYRVGLYSSPHIHHFEERVRIDGKTVSAETIVWYFRQVEAARGDVPLTFFEFTTLAIMQILADAGLDVAILEVGLGGRLDAVNLVDAQAAVVTNVDIDHVDYLGDTRELIGYEKAGTFRPGQIAVYGDEDPPQALLAYAREVGARLHILGRDYCFSCKGKCWDYTGPRRRFTGLDLPGLQGKTQVKNAANVLMVLESMQDSLPFDEKAVCSGLAGVCLQGRFQVLQKAPVIIADVAHNPHAAAVLAENLRGMGNFHLTHAVFGAMADKDIGGVLAPFKDSVDFWYLTGLPLSRGATTAVLKEKLLAAGVFPDRIRLFDTPADALAAARLQARKDDRIVAFGSFWVVAGITPPGQAGCDMVR
ncbi:MAG: bifunctional tetrahydrofolate synthase/dihydrofolate synthase [Oxalobacter formigenes]|nr:bifunctional tetrahydrofolate synthase/dihydrofolate synthase [Oxalobacter formigenes]